jgi:hypothetical protein
VLLVRRTPLPLVAKSPRTQTKHFINKQITTMNRGHSQKRGAEGFHSQRQAADIILLEEFADEEERGTIMFASDIAVVPQGGVIAYPGTADIMASSTSSNLSPEEDRLFSGILLKKPPPHNNEEEGRCSKRLKLASSTWSNSSSTTPPASHNHHTHYTQALANHNQSTTGRRLHKCSGILMP